MDCGAGRPKLSVQNNGGVRAMEIDESRLEGYFKEALEGVRLAHDEAALIERETKVSIRAALEACEVVPGAVLHERGTHLVIR